MPPPIIDAGPLTLRPFREADIAWVCEVSQDPAVQRNLAEVFAPYRMEHAAYFVRRMALAAWDEGKRAEFLVAEAASGTRLTRAEVDHRLAWASPTERVTRTPAPSPLPPANPSKP